MSIEAVEALDRLTQIALDNTSEDVHDAVYEDAKRVRAEWRAHESREFVPSSYGGTYPPQLSDVICSDCGWLTGGPNAHPDAEAQHREQMAGQASRKVEAAPSGTDREALEHECEWECVSEMEHLERAYDGLKVEYADYRNAVRTRLSQAVRVELTDEMVEKAMVAAIQSADIPTGMRGTLLGATPTIRERVDLDDVVRVVLKAALGGGE